MVVSADNDFTAAGHGARDERIVIGVPRRRIRKWIGFNDLGVGYNKGEEWRQRDPGNCTSSRSPTRRYSSSTSAETTSSISSSRRGFEHPAWNATEKDTRDHDVGVNDDLHRSDRTASIAAATSAGFIPASRAWRRASPTMSSNSDIGGGWIVRG